MSAKGVYSWHFKKMLKVYIDDKYTINIVFKSKIRKKNWMLQMNFSPFYFTKYLSENLKNTEEDDKKIWSNI